MRRLQLSSRPLRGHSVVALRGELDLATAEEFDLYLHTARTVHGDHVVLDLRALEFMDSRGLSVILGCHRSVASTGGSLALVAPQIVIRRILRITGLDQRLSIFDSIEQATRAVPARRA